MGKCTSTQIIKLKTKSNRSYSIDIEHSMLDLESSFSKHEILNKQQKSLIASTLLSHHLFYYLNPQDLEKLINNFRFRVVEAFEIIYSQGSKIENFYIVGYGGVDVIIDGEMRCTKGSGKTFGAMDFIINTFRKKTVRTNQETGLFILNKRDFMDAIQSIHQHNLIENKNFIDSLQIFKDLSDQIRYFITENSIQHKFDDGENIIAENEQGYLLYILKQGTISIKQSGKEKFRMNSQELFGESIILNPLKAYSESVYSIGTVHCLSIETSAFKQILGQGLNEILYKSLSRHSLCSDEILGMISTENIDSLVEQMDWVELAPGEIAVNAGCKSCLIYTICCGTLQSGKLEFRSCQAFGLGNKNHKIVKKNSLVAKTRAVIGVVYKATIESLIKISCKMLKDLLNLTCFLNKIEFLSNLGLSKLRYLASKAKILIFDSKQIIYEKNQRADSFYIIYKGKVELVSNNKIVRVLNKYDIFGESCIIENFRNKLARTANECTCLKIPVNEYLILIESINTHRLLHRKSLISLFDIKKCVKIKKRVESQHKVCILSSLGGKEPMFSVVVVNKTLINSTQECAQIINGKKIAEHTEHSFLLKYVKSFIDKYFVYIFYEYQFSVPFNEVPKSVIDEDYVKIIAACLLCVIEYLHDRSIMYRDLCTDNISIKTNGYPILKIFSSAKVIKNKTFTVLGDPLYNAPEFHQDKGYTKSADLWSLGIFIYFHLYSKYPFDVKKSDTPLEIYSKISSKILDFPKDLSQIEVHPLLESLLSKDPKMRNNTQSIKYSKWFSSIDWNRIQTEKYSMKFKPSDTLKVKNKDFPSLQKYVNVIDT